MFEYMLRRVNSGSVDDRADDDCSESDWDGV